VFVIVLVFTGFPDRLLRAQSQELFDNWLSDADGYTQAMQEHHKTKKPLLVYFYTDWCPYCRRLNQEIIASEPVQTYLARIVRVRINPERDERESALANKYHIQGFPSLFLFPAAAKRPLQLSTYRWSETGWVLMTPEEFVHMCQTAEGFHE